MTTFRTIFTQKRVTDVCEGFYILYPYILIFSKETENNINQDNIIGKQEKRQPVILAITVVLLRFFNIFSC